MIRLFTADWCTSCQALKQNLGDELDSVEIIDADAEPDMIIEANIRSIPTMIKYDDIGNEVSRQLGNMNKTAFISWRDE